MLKLCNIGYIYNYVERKTVILYQSKIIGCRKTVVAPALKPNDKLMPETYYKLEVTEQMSMNWRNSSGDT